MHFPEDKSELRTVYNDTQILRRPISGFVSGYHSLPYILVAPDEENENVTIEISGRITVSPRFIISTTSVAEQFGEIFDPESFDKTLHGKVFSFSWTRNRHMKVASEKFQLHNYDVSPKDHVERLLDTLQMQEDTKTGFIVCPRFNFYPVSIDRFISEILDREFRL